MRDVCRCWARNSRDISDRHEIKGVEAGAEIAIPVSSALPRDHASGSSARRCMKQRMSVGVDVDVDAAVIAYRPAVGEERSLPSRRVASADLYEATPWRVWMLSCTSRTSR